MLSAVCICLIGQIYHLSDKNFVTHKYFMRHLCRTKRFVRFWPNFRFGKWCKYKIESNLFFALCISKNKIQCQNWCLLINFYWSSFFFNNKRRSNDFFVFNMVFLSKFMGGFLLPAISVQHKRSWLVRVVLQSVSLTLFVPMSDISDIVKNFN